MENLEMIEKSKKTIAMNRKVRAPKGEVFEHSLDGRQGRASSVEGPAALPLSALLPFP